MRSAGSAGTLARKSLETSTSSRAIVDFNAFHFGARGDLRSGVEVSAFFLARRAVDERFGSRLDLVATAEVALDRPELLARGEPDFRLVGVARTRRSFGAAGAGVRLLGRGGLVRRDWRAIVV